MKVVHASRYAASMSCLQVYISTTYAELSDAFGPPTVTGSGDGKVSAEWILKIGHKVVTIYDYKENGTPYCYYNWHVGGHSREVLTLLEKIVEYKNMDATVKGA